MLREARELCKNAISGMRAAGRDSDAKEPEANLAKVEDALKRLP